MRVAETLQQMNNKSEDKTSADLSSYWQDITVQSISNIKNSNKLSQEAPTLNVQKEISQEKVTRSRLEWNSQEGRNLRLRDTKEHELIHLRHIPGYSSVPAAATSSLNAKPPKKATRQRCKYCYQRVVVGTGKEKMPKFKGSKTPFGCNICQVPLCKKARAGAPSCFVLWHTENNIPVTQLRLRHSSATPIPSAPSAVNTQYLVQTMEAVPGPPPSTSWVTQHKNPIINHNRPVLDTEQVDLSKVAVPKLPPLQTTSPSTTWLPGIVTGEEATCGSASGPGGLLMQPNPEMSPSSTNSHRQNMDSIWILKEIADIHNSIDSIPVPEPHHHGKNN